MPENNTNNGKLAKLTIKAFKEPTYDTQKDQFEVMFNPQEYSLKYEIESDAAQGIGTSDSEPTFKKIKPQNFSLDFTIDGTGATGSKVDVEKKVSKFLDVTYIYKGAEHRPWYLKIHWGSLNFKCILKSTSVKYTLFNNDGKPIRAKINASFQGFTEDQLRVAKEDSNSPDLTHMRTVNEGDTLPLMCYRIYGDSRYYLHVAKANNLVNFRNLKTGQKIFFPPITD